MSTAPALDTAPSGPAAPTRLNRLVRSDAVGALGSGLLAFALALTVGAVLIPADRCPTTW